MRLRKWWGAISALCLIGALLFAIPTANAQTEDENGEFVELEYVSPPVLSEGPDDPAPQREPASADVVAANAAPERDSDPLVATYAAGDEAVLAGDQEAFETAAAELREAGRQDLALALEKDWNDVRVEQEPGTEAATNATTNHFGINGAPCAFSTLQSAINAANPTDTIRIAPGTYPNTNVNVNKPLVITQGDDDCTDNPSLDEDSEFDVVLSGGPAANDAVIEVFAGGRLSLLHVTVTEGSGPEGNIRVVGDSSLLLVNVLSRRGTNSLDGGGLLVVDGSVTIVGTGPGSDLSPNGFETTIRENIATGNGGGVAVLENGELTGFRLTVEENISDNNQVGGLGDFDSGGGGVYVSGLLDLFLLRANANEAGFGGGLYVTGEATLDSPIISDNNAMGAGLAIPGGGGGISVAVNGIAEIEGAADISDNRAAGSGGAISVGNTASLTVTGSGDVQPTIERNQSDDNGGAVALFAAAIATLDTVELRDNSTDGDGGAVWVGANATLDLVERSACNFNIPANEWCNEVINNTSAGEGAAIYSDGGDILVEQTAFIDNDGNKSIDLNGDASARIEKSLLVREDAGTDGVITTGGTSELILIASTILEADGVGVDDDSGSVTVVRLLTDTGFAGGSYSGICNVSTDGTNIPGVTVVGDLGLGGTNPAVHSPWEPLPFSPAVDVCANNEGVIGDILDRALSDGDGLAGASFDAGAYEIPRGQGIFCGGVQATIVGTGAGETLFGSSGDDVIAALGGDDTILGQDGDDLVCGGTGNDEIFGGAGNDDLRGQSGDDDVDGGNHDDVIFGGPGDDIILGGNGNDDLRGQGGNDSLNGQGGVDQILGQSGADVINVGTNGNRGTTFRVQGGGGPDTIVGSSGDDDLEGNFGNDVIQGFGGNDILSGGNANDDIFGGDGDDEITGNDGRDELFGGAGQDELLGGPGDDELFGEAGNDTLEGQGGVDLCDGGSSGGDGAGPTCETVVNVP